MTFFRASVETLRSEAVPDASRAGRQIRPLIPGRNEAGAGANRACPDNKARVVPGFTKNTGLLHPDPDKALWVPGRRSFLSMMGVMLAGTVLPGWEAEAVPEGGWVVHVRLHDVDGWQMEMSYPIENPRFSAIAALQIGDLVTITDRGGLVSSEFTLAEVRTSLLAGLPATCIPFGRRIVPPAEAGRHYWTLAR